MPKTKTTGEIIFAYLSQYINAPEYFEEKLDAELNNITQKQNDGIKEIFLDYKEMFSNLSEFKSKIKATAKLIKPDVVNLNNNINNNINNNDDDDDNDDYDDDDEYEDEIKEEKALKDIKNENQLFANQNINIENDLKVNIENGEDLETATKRKIGQLINEAAQIYEKFDKISKRIEKKEAKSKAKKKFLTNPGEIKENINKIEVEHTPEYIQLQKDYGVKKSAARWIEEVQARIKGGDRVSNYDIAYIIAARQIANTVPGYKSKLVSKVISEGELIERAEALMKQKPFKDYVYKLGDVKDEDGYDDAVFYINDIDKSLITDGHGGRIENDFAIYIKQRDDVNTLDRNYYGRYQAIPKFNYASYADYIQKTKKDYTQRNGKIKIDTTNPNLMLQAASMLVAYTIKNEQPNVFRFGMLTKEVVASPEFIFMKKHHPESLNSLLNGNIMDFKNQLDAVMYDPNAENKQYTKEEELTNYYRKCYMTNVYDALFKGNQLGTIAEEKSNETYKEIKAQEMDKIKFLGLDPSEVGQKVNINDLDENLRPIGLKPELGNASQIINQYLKFENSKYDETNPLSKMDATRILNDLRENLKYLEAAAKLPKNEKYADPDLANKLLSKLRKVVQKGESFLNPPVFQDSSKKSAEAKLAEYKNKTAKDYIESVNNYIEVYKKAQKEHRNKEWKKIENSSAFPKDAKPMKFITELSLKDKDNTAVTYVEKRGPKYKKMVNACKDYANNINTVGEPDPRLTMKAINAILDYQTGKEKVMSGDAKIRFDNSMRFLATVTVGTHFEKYFDEQIAKINKIRGCKPGSKDYIKKEDYYDGFTLAKESNIYNRYFNRETEAYNEFLTSYEKYRQDISEKDYADEEKINKLVDAIKNYQDGREIPTYQFERAMYDETMSVLALVANDLGDLSILNNQIEKHNQEVAEYNEGIKNGNDIIPSLNQIDVIAKAEKDLGVELDNINPKKVVKGPVM